MSTSLKRRLSVGDTGDDDDSNKRLKGVYREHTLSYPTSAPALPVAFQQPLPLVTFSYDSSHNLQFNNSSLRYYVDPPPGADLKHRYENWTKRPEETGRIDSLLEAWLKAKEKMPEGSMNGGVIAWRGAITR
jgi:RAT1-interacting protein